MGILATILGSGKVIEEGFKLIDSIHTSDEEEIHAKTEQKVRVMESYAPFKLAQRYLALMFGFNYLFCFQLCLWMMLMDKGDIDQVIKLMGAFSIGTIMLIIVTFYFGGGFAEGLASKLKDKKSGT